MDLYHYTSADQLQFILDEKKLELTPSNLLEPKNPHFITNKHGFREFADETDSFKPVVWFTTCNNFEYAKKCGISYNKTECAIVIPNADKKVFLNWEKWAIKNRINPIWLSRLKKTAPLWRTFYILETEYIFTDDTRIMYRPDILKTLLDGMAQDLNLKGS